MKIIMMYVPVYASLKAIVMAYSVMLIPLQLSVVLSMHIEIGRISGTHIPLNVL